MKKEKQKFEGVLTDKELYLIEDALENWGNDKKEVKKECEKLILKLYTSFSEVKEEGQNIPRFNVK
jgi:hypothetical protein